MFNILYINKINGYLHINVSLSVIMCDVQAWWQGFKKFWYSNNQFDRKYNYFDDPTKLFSDLYLPKFLDTNKIVLFL